MRIILLLLLLTAQSLLAQQPFYGGVANTYLLTEKDGYPGYNYALTSTSKDGTTYTLQYNNTFIISGNNYFQSFDTLQKIPGTIHCIKAISNSEAWVAGSNYIAVFKNNRVDTIINVPFTVRNINEHYYNDSLVLFANDKDRLVSYLFNGKSIIKPGKTINQPNFTNDWFIMNEKKDTWLSKKIPGGIELFIYNLKTSFFEPVKKIMHPDIEFVYYLKDEDHFLITSSSSGSTSYWYNEGSIKKMPFSFMTGGENMLRLTGEPYSNLHHILVTSTNNFHVVTFNDTGVKREFPFSLPERATGVELEKGGAYLVKTGNQAYRIFPYINKYPTIYDKSGTSNLFSVRQDDLGRIWAGSYQGQLSLIDKYKIQQLAEKRFDYMNAGSFHNGFMYLVGEGTGGLVQFNKQGYGKQVIPNTYTGFATYVSANKKYFYYGTASGGGLWRTTMSALEKRRPQWHKIDSAKGSTVLNILTIAEDTLGRIWYGAGKQALAVYDPLKDKATTWETGSQQSPFGAFSSAVDGHGTVWIGSAVKGLWYYSDYTKPASPSSFKKVIHPLLNSGKIISALTIYKNWLVIAATDKILLLNIDSLYYHNKTFVRYLNPQEAAFTAPTEQNAMITSHTDSTVWFSTSDMLYQWNVKQWLAQPTFKTTVKTMVVTKENETSLVPNRGIGFEPGFNSFEIQCRYVSPDKMSRYLSAVLVKNGEIIDMPLPSLTSNFSFKNLQSGNYTFLLHVYESDGSITHYKYPISLKKFLWQQSWFWLIISIAIGGVLAYLFNLNKKKQLAEQQVKLKEAEMAAFKSEQEKKLAKLQLITLSNQFRPHFILNALNTIGAQMDDKPEAESVLSRLGESVNLIFNHAQQQKILHPLQNEWSLVINVIHIHTLMYLKKLEVTLPNSGTLLSINHVQVPLGILQIPVENALLHGLSNRERGPWHLIISIAVTQQFVTVNITDNGVGRTKSATLSNFTKHGTGTKNQNDIIQIINAANTANITITYTDDIYVKDGEKYGTSVCIQIPTYLNYDNR